MNRAESKRVLKKGILNFQREITVFGEGVKTDILEEVIVEDCRLLAYIAKLSVVASTNCRYGLQYRFFIEYVNEEIALCDIVVADSVQNVMNVFCQAIGNYKDKVVFIIAGKVDMHEIYEEFIVKHKTFYPNFIKANIGYSYSGSFNYTMCMADFSYRIGKVKLNMMEQEVEQEVERIAKMLFHADMPDEAKAYLAHNYLIATTEYYLKDDATSLERSYIQSAYGALINKKCVCQGYAEAFKRLMDKAQIPCDMVCGQIKGHTDYHAWNIIQINQGREAYHIDVTWDDATNEPTYVYFGKNDVFFLATREWNRKYHQSCGVVKNIAQIARRYVYINKNQLLSKGIPAKVLDV